MVPLKRTSGSKRRAGGRAGVASGWAAAVATTPPCALFAPFLLLGWKETVGEFLATTSRPTHLRHLFWWRRTDSQMPLPTESEQRTAGGRAWAGQWVSLLAGPPRCSSPATCLPMPSHCLPLPLHLHHPLLTCLPPTSCRCACHSILTTPLQFAILQ